MEFTEITSRENNLVKHACRLVADASYRKKHGEFIGEGKTLLFEAVKSGLEPKEIFVDETNISLSDQDMSVLNNLSQKARIIKTNSKIISLISDVQTPTGLIFKCKMPESNGDIPKDGNIIVVENLRDPGNLGTIIRTADAFAISAVVACGQCVDMFSPKVMRAAMGAAFRVNFIRKDLPNLITELRENNIKLFGAALADDSVDVHKVRLKGAAVAIGNEANGLSEQILSAADGKIIIPMPGMAESLNAAVAAAICMWEMSSGEN